METRSGGRTRLGPVRRNVFLPVSIAVLLLSLSVAPGCCHRCFGTGGKAAPAEAGAETGTVGVTVTKEVPHSKEAIPLGIPDKDAAMPLPSAGDKAIHSHKIPRAAYDNCERTE